MKNHPHLAELYTIYKVESQPFRKVHRMIDLFESIIKTHTVVILGEYFKQNKYSNAAKGLLATGLRTPSLGTWQLFSRVLYKELAAENHVFFQVDFAKEFEKLDKDLDNQKTNVISFRNEYAHGATPSDELCSEDIKRFEPFLESLLASKWLANSSLLELEGKVSISNSSTENEISLYPILLFKPEPNAQPYVFFNDLKNDKVGLLNYPLSKHYKEKDFFQEFNTYLPLKEWKNTGSSEFHQRIEELTETFKGRTQERLRIKEFIEKKDKGYFSIQGNPGIGKSALIAQLFKDLSNQTPKLPIKLVEYFIRRGTAQANSTYLLNYLLKATDNHFSEGKNIQAEGKTNWDLQQQLFAKWRAYGDANLKEKLVFFIDGLDEGIENDILKYLPRENFKDIIVIYGSRPGGHKDIEAFWTELPIEYHQSLLLTGLSKNDIRALLYEVGNKYEIEKDSAWIDTVEKRSEGNPLYLKLLCNAIENGSIPYNDPKALPTEINDYYKAILTRYANDSLDGDTLLSSLFVFAAAYDYLTPVHLQHINGFGTAQSIRIESALKEVLYENPLTEEVLDYQLFHDSFREFLVQFYPTELRRAETKLLEFCSTWNTLQHTFEQRYALQHYTSHLTQNSSEQSILTLINLRKNKAYTDTQKKVLRGFTATKQLYQDIINHTIKSANTDEALEAALALVDLKYEEQNDAASILAMVANNEIDLALLRITAFGGESKEDKQRQFILYMLCLMELTLLESKIKPWRKSAIEKLLAQFEEQIPIDHSLVNWNNFFPSYLMFQMAYEWAQMGLDYIIIYKRTESWDDSWILEKGPYSDLQFNVLIECAHSISTDRGKSSTLMNISTELAKQSKHEKAFVYARGIINDSAKSRALAAISSELFKQGQHENTNSTIQEALELARGIKDNYFQCLALVNIYEFINYYEKELSNSLLKDAEFIAKNLIDEEQKCKVFKKISITLAKQRQIKKALLFAENITYGYIKEEAYEEVFIEIAKKAEFEEAYKFASKLKDDTAKIRALLYIASELHKKNMLGRAEEVTENAYKILNKIDSNYFKDIAYIEFSRFYAMFGLLENSLNTLMKINYEDSKSKGFHVIMNELIKINLYDDVFSILIKSVSHKHSIPTDLYKDNILANISYTLTKKNCFENAFFIVSKIDNIIKRIQVFSSLSTLLKNQNLFNKSYFVMEKALILVDKLNSDNSKDIAFKGISYQFMKQGKIKEALDCSSKITIDSWKFSAIKNISIDLAKKGQHKRALEITSKLNRLDKIVVLAFVSSEFFNLGMLDDSFNLMQEVNNLIQDESSIREKSLSLTFISGELIKQGMIKEGITALQDALALTELIKDENDKKISLRAISCEFAKQGKYDNALNCARSINIEHDRSYALKCISNELVKSGKLDEAFKCAQIIENKIYKYDAINIISFELAKNEIWQLSEKIVMEISQLNEKHNCWKYLGSNFFYIDGWNKALHNVNQLQSDEARLFYLKGWAENVTVSDATKELIIEALPYFVNDTESIEKILQQHALHEVVFNSPSAQKIKQLNSTLNIQWFLDIHNSLPQSTKATRLSSNLDNWLHEIEDEDDQDQILLWAKQVAKGKITEEEFQAKIKEFNSL